MGVGRDAADGPYEEGVHQKIWVMYGSCAISRGPCVVCAHSVPSSSELDTTHHAS